MPVWSGHMQMLQQGEYPGKSSVTFFPMIDIDPTNMTCIYSTLHFIISSARKYGTKAVITFDQPLFWKTPTIITAEPNGSGIKGILLRLGGFHTIMSFLGSIGHLMTGTGLQEVLETVYAANAVCHMMSGQTSDRAIRGHMLVDTAINALLISKIFDIIFLHLRNLTILIRFCKFQKPTFA